MLKLGTTITFKNPKNIYILGPSEVCFTREADENIKLSPPA
jgi:hypothetical protein